MRQSRYGQNDVMSGWLHTHDGRVVVVR